MNSQQQTSPSESRSEFTRTALKRPSWTCGKIAQSVYLVRDRSGSMYGQKATDASAACEELIRELAEPENKDIFEVSVVDFAGRAELVQPPAFASSIVASVPKQNVKWLSDFGTNLTAGLELVLALLRRPGENPVGTTQLRPVVLVFTDGCHNRGAAPYGVADQIKATADIVAVAFGSDADEALMRQVALSPQHFYRCKDGKELRAFLARVGATLTRTAAARTCATRALADIKQ